MTLNVTSSSIPNTSDHFAALLSQPKEYFQEVANRCLVLPILRIGDYII